MQKRFLSLLMAALMVFSLFPFAASAANIVDSGACGENVTWTLDSDGVLTISGAGAMADFSGSSSPFCSRSDAIHSVIIAFGVTTVGNYAFYDCSTLTAVSIPESVTSIGEAAFTSCSALASATIPESVTSIGRYAFADCGSLTSFIIPEGVTSIGEGVFAECSSLTSVTIPESVTSIGSYAFKTCSALTSVTIPDGVTSVGNYAFYDCSAVTSVAIPESVVSIGEYAFGGCSALTSVTIPESVMRIGKCAFIDCTSLTSVTFPDGITSIGDDLFVNCTGLTSVTIPEGVTSIGSFAFSDCSSLTAVTIPDSVTSIGEYAFSGCTSLTDVYYSGTKTQWDAISISDNNDDLLNAARHDSGDYDDCPSKSFTDVDFGAYYHVPLDWAVSTGVTTGVTPTTFAPNRSCTRAQAVTFLWRAAGSPEPTLKVHPFSDVSASAYYYKAVLWAFEKGVTTGLDAAHFAPNNTATRAQTVTLLWRMQGEPAPTGGVTFPDVPANAYYAKAVSWAAENGVTTGTNGRFNPQNDCTRAQTVTFLYRALAE